MKVENKLTKNKDNNIMIIIVLWKHINQIRKRFTLHIKYQSNYMKSNNENKKIILIEFPTDNRIKIYVHNKSLHLYKNTIQIIEIYSLYRLILKLVINGLIETII